MNFGNIETAIFAWVSASVANNVTIIWDEPEAPRPNTPSIRLSFIAGPTIIGHDEIRDIEGNPNAFRILGQRSLTLSVTSYGAECFQIISDLQTSLSDPDKRGILSAENISVLTQSSIRDITVPLETKYERRAQLDFSLLVLEDKTINPGTIESVEITSSIGDIESSILAIGSDD